MSLRKRHTGLWVLTGLCLLSVAVVITITMLMPIIVTGKLPDAVAPLIQTIPSSSDTNTPSQYLPSLASYAPIWQMQLRPRVTATITVAPPEPARHPPPPPPTKAFTAKLTGTILEDNHSMALFTTQTGEIEFVMIGQTVEDARVVQIQPQKVILDRNGQTLTVELTEQSTSPKRMAPTRSTRPNIYNRRRALP